MGERNSRTGAIILSLRESGENNRLVTAISPDLGIFNCLLYGGPKSRLRSFVQTFNSGEAYLYTDSVRKTIKLSDFDLKSSHPSIRENLYKSWAASLACEIVLKTKCAGDSENAFVLLSALLDGIDAVDEREARLGMLRFLWRYLGLLGVQPESRQCVSCGASLLSSEMSASYIESHNGFMCRDCIPFSSDRIRQEASLFRTDIHGLTYLAAINELSPGKVRELLLPTESAYALKILLYHLMERSCGTRLETLESGHGIL